MSIQNKFDAAVRGVQNLPKEGPFQPSNDLKLKLYSLYKQATEGPCTNSKPAFYDLIGRAKWSSWKKLDTMSREDAMTQYVDEIIKLIKHMSENNKSSADEHINDRGGPFFQILELHDLHLQFSTKDVDAAMHQNGHAAALETNFLEQNLLTTSCDEDHLRSS